MSIDWSWVALQAPVVVTALKDIVLAGAAISTAVLGWKALGKWRDETIGKRKLELAEEVLASFYHVREIIQDARTALVLTGEMVPEEGVPEEVTRSAYYAPTRRLRHSFDRILEWRTKRHRFAAVFGIDAISPWGQIESVLSEIDAASDAMLRLRGESVLRTDPSAAFYDDMRKVLARRADGDPITPRLDKAVAAIERACAPIIRASLRS